MNRKDSGLRCWQRRSGWPANVGTVLAACAILSGALSLSGCATLFTDGYNSQAVEIITDPPGAVCSVPQGASVKTPGKIRLARKGAYTITCSLDGYEPAALFVGQRTNGWLFGNLVSWIIPGFIVDYQTGAAYALSPDYFQVQMRRTVAAAPKP